MVVRTNVLIYKNEIKLVKQVLTVGRFTATDRFTIIAFKRSTGIA